MEDEIVQVQEENKSEEVIEVGEAEHAEVATGKYQNNSKTLSLRITFTTFEIIRKFFFGSFGK